jgi:hypothetical protein
LADEEVPPMDIDTRIANLVAATAHGTAIEQELLRTEVLAIGPLITPNVGTSAPPVAFLKTRREAYFKRFCDQVPRLCAHYKQDRMDVPLNEVVAWRLAYAMGAPWDQLVPTAVLRKIDGFGGALINGKPGSVDYNALTEAKAQTKAAGFFDALIGNQDRNARNFRYDTTNKRLGLIDHGFAFARPGDPINNGSFFFGQRRLANEYSLTAAEHAALDALVQSGDLHGLRGFLPVDRVDALEARAQGMLRSGCLPAVGLF